MTRREYKILLLFMVLAIINFVLVGTGIWITRNYANTPATFSDSKIRRNQEPVNLKEDKTMTQKLRITVQFDVEVNDLANWNVSTLRDAAIQQQEWFDSGDADVVELLNQSPEGKDLTVTVKGVED